MEQPISPGKGIDHRLVGQGELVSKVVKGQVVTEVIRQDRLSDFLSTASATGFKVEKIADEGEEFPYSSGKYENEQRETGDGKSYYGKPQRRVSNVRVQGKGYIAVSIERPEDSKDHGPFWENLRRLDQKKV